MNIETLRDFCLSLKGVEERTPFGPDTLVFYVKDKMFCLMNIDEFDFINVKCDPEEAILLREQYSEVTPGYHMNKTHWNSVATSGKISDKLMMEWIRNSYELVISKLPKKTRQELSGK